MAIARYRCADRAVARRRRSENRPLKRQSASASQRVERLRIAVRSPVGGTRRIVVFRFAHCLGLGGRVCATVPWLSSSARWRKSAAGDPPGYGANPEMRHGQAMIPATGRGRTGWRAPVCRAVRRIARGGWHGRKSCLRSGALFRIRCADRSGRATPPKRRGGRIAFSFSMTAALSYLSGFLPTFRPSAGPDEVTSR